VDRLAAERLLDKLRTFVATELDDDERALFAALVAPAIAQAYAPSEVEGYEFVEWQEHALPDDLVRAVREAKIRVVGLEP
jgi:hypothetical protein